MFSDARGFSPIVTVNYGAPTAPPAVASLPLAVADRRFTVLYGARRLFQPVPAQPILTIPPP
jgi:hypothetical protein